MPPKDCIGPNDRALAIYNLTVAEARYLEEWRPEERARLAADWRRLYFGAFRMMKPGQVHDDGYHVATRREDRLEVTVRARAERRAS